MPEKSKANIHKELADDTKEESSKIALNCAMRDETHHSC